MINKDRYERIKEKIETETKTQTKAQIIGRIREKKVLDALVDLKQKKLIRDFLKTEKLGYTDLMLGIDFYVVFVGNNEYYSQPFSVTGSSWVGSHFNKHPEIPSIIVFLDETQDSIQRKILQLKKK